MATPNTSALVRDYPTSLGTLHARVIFESHVQRKPRPEAVVWSIECPACGRQSDLTGPELRGDIKPMCITAGCRGIRQADYEAALEGAITPVKELATA